MFWDLRNKVVHAGYEPTDAELDTIVSWTLTILGKHKALKNVLSEHNPNVALYEGLVPST